MAERGPTGLLFCEADRAESWRRGLLAAGFSPIVAETLGSKSRKGEFEVAVPSDEADRARRFVSEVLSGARKLPAPPRLSSPLLRFALIIVVAIGALIAAALLSR